MKYANAKYWLLLQALYCMPAVAQAAAPTAPAYTVVRYDEDYSYLKDPSLRADPFDPIKYIPLTTDPAWYASLGGQIRDRYEYFNHNLFGAGPQDQDGYNLLRVMANADVHLGPNLRVFVQGISATEQGRNGGPRAFDVDEFDLHQGFVDLKIPFDDRDSFVFRAGRQDLSFGAQRLVGALDWANIPRSFDGFRGTFATADNRLDVFYARPVLADKYDLDSDVPGTSLSGIYDTWKLPGALAKAHTQLELYGLYVNRAKITFPPEGTSGENRYTLGGRLSGNPKPFDFDIEPDYQFGRFNGGNISAYSLASVVGYTFDDLACTPRPFVGFDIASGDRHPHDGNLGTFDQLFASGHMYFGYIDAIGRQNIIDLHPGIDFTLLTNRQYVQKLTTTVEYHQFWRQSDSDAVYNASGGVLRASGSSSASSVGSELDLLANWQVNRHLLVCAGYSHFFAGEFIDQTGAHQDIDFVYCGLTYTF